jgi:hypothetical protein
MASIPAVVKGIVHGKLIELDRDLGLPDGQEVTVELHPILPPGEGIRQSAGAWADAGEELDAWLAEMERSRQQDRPEFSCCLELRRAATGSTFQRPSPPISI